MIEQEREEGSITADAITGFIGQGSSQVVCLDTH